MRWEDERWVKLYTRDTTDWLSLPWQAQGLFGLILRKVDKAGILVLGKHGKRGLAAHIGGPSAWPEIEPHLDALLADGCVELRDGCLVIPNFLTAQEAVQSDAARKRSQRERARATALADTGSPQYVTNRDDESQNVTDGHARSRRVTSSHVESLQRRREEKRGEEKTPPTPRGGGGGGGVELSSEPAPAAVPHAIATNGASQDQQRRVAAAAILGQDERAWQIWEAMVRSDVLRDLEDDDHAVDAGSLARQASALAGELASAGLPDRVDLALGAIAYLAGKIGDERTSQGPTMFVLPMKAFAKRLFGVFREWLKCRGDPYAKREAYRATAPGNTHMAAPSGGQKRV